MTRMERMYIATHQELEILYNDGLRTRIVQNGIEGSPTRYRRHLANSPWPVCRIWVAAHDYDVGDEDASATSGR